MKSAAEIASGLLAFSIAGDSPLLVPCQDGGDEWFVNTPLLDRFRLALVIENRGGKVHLAIETLRDHYDEAVLDHVVALYLEAKRLRALPGNDTTPEEVADAAQ